MAKVRGDHSTGDLFGRDEAYFPVRTPQDLPSAMDLKQGIAKAMSRAVRESGKTAPEIAGIMTDLLGDDLVTPAQLYAYTSESRTSHTISIVRWMAFVRATQCKWLWDFLLKNEGLIVLEGEEAHHAEASLLEAQARELDRRAKAHRAAAPLKIQVRKPRGRDQR